MTIPNSHLIVEEAKERRLRLQQEAELHNAHRLLSFGGHQWPHRARRDVGQALIAVGEWLCADEHRPARNSPTLAPN